MNTLEHRRMDAPSDALSDAECAGLEFEARLAAALMAEERVRAESTVRITAAPLVVAVPTGGLMKIAARGHPDRRARARLVMLAIAGVLAWVGRRRTTCSIT